MNLLNMTNLVNLKVRKLLVIFFFIVISINYTSAQAPAYTGKEYNTGNFPKSPEAAILGKYLDIPATNHTGVMNFSVPLYDFEVDGMKFPISLEYNTSGIKLDETASRVGLGWYLKLGGVSLTKQVLGAWDNIDYQTKIILPDNFNPNQPTGHAHNEIGIKITGSTSNSPNDLEPDMYSYSLFNNSGKFILDFQKDKILTIPHTPIKGSYNNSLFTLTDDSGVNYKFREYFKGFSLSTCSSGAEYSHPNYVSEYFVEEIKFPNSAQNITYVYNDQIPISGINSVFSYGTSVTQNEGLTIENYNPVQYSGGMIVPPVAQHCRNFYSNNQVANIVLKKINFPNGSMEIIYSSEYDGTYRSDIVDDVYIKKILIKDLNNTIVKEFVLDIDYFVSSGTYNYTENWNKGNNYRLRLKGLEESKSGQKHVFDYHSGNLPPRMTDKKDLWGVYNGANNTTSIGSGKYYDWKFHTGFLTYNSGNDLRPNIDFAKVGNLKSIKYPTGGSVEVDYELDDFLVNSWYRDQYQLLGLLYDNEYSKTGTIRVSEIRLNNGEGSQITRRYLYKNPSTGKTSGRNYGTMNLTPIATSFIDISPLTGSTPSVQYYNYATNNPGWQLGTVDGKSVGYTHVQEVYTDLSNPSQNYKVEFEYKHSTDVEESEWTTYNPNSVINMSYPMHYPERGLLWKKKYFNDQNQIIKLDSISYEYDGYHNSLSNSRPANDPSVLFEGVLLRKHFERRHGYGGPAAFFESYFPVRTYWIKTLENHSTEYLLNGEIAQTTSYNYSPTYKHIYPVNTITTNSVGETLRTEYQYPQDLPSRPHAIDLIAENRISTPLVTKAYNNSAATSVQETVYEKDGTTGNITLPKYVFSKKGASTLDNTLPSEDLKITYNNYDDKGNLTQYTLANGTPVSIIWGYDGQYPLAKVEGVAYNALSSYINTLQTASNNGTLTASSFDTLRNGMNTTANNALVTSYIYKPLVGVTTIIQPNGQKETYEYDTSGRLMHVKDHNGNILKKMDYHYKP